MTNEYKIIEETGCVHKGYETIRARIVEVNEDRKLDLRVYRVGKDGDWQPTKRGITVHEDLQEDLKNTVVNLCNRAEALRKEGEQ